MSEHTPLTKTELSDLAAAYGWWRAHGDPEMFYDTLNDALAARTSTATTDTGLREVVVSILKRWNCPGCFAIDHPCGKPECVYREELREAILADVLATPASTEEES